MCFDLGAALRSEPLVLFCADLLIKQGLLFAAVVRLRIEDIALGEGADVLSGRGHTARDDCLGETPQLRTRSVRQRLVKKHPCLIL